MISIEKDSLRTDRHISHFEGKEGNENIEALKRVLGAFVLYDPQLGEVLTHVYSQHVHVCMHNKAILLNSLVQ